MEHGEKNAPQQEEQVVEDLDFEPEDELGTAGAAKAKVQKLRLELEKVKKERSEYLDGWQRSKADAINMKKEAFAAGERQASRAKEGVIEDIIPALDSFDMAAGSASWETIDPQWRGGMDQVRNQLLSALSSNGVERYGKVGEIYDPYTHDVAEEKDDVPGEPGSVFKILRYGYKAGDKVLRAAQVVIKKHQE
jgi:molecular chaperone GrpE